MTDLQKIKEAVSEEVLQQMSAGVIVVEAPSGKIILRNRRAQQWREDSLSQARTTKLEDAGGFEVFHPDGRPYEIEEWPLMRSIRDGEEVRAEEFLYPLADGSQLWLRCDSYPIYDDEGRIVAGVMAAHDITELKREEERLKRSEERFRVLVEGVSDYAIFMLDTEGHIESWNDGARRIKGYSQEEILGQHFSIFYSPEDAERGKPEGELREAETHGVYEEEGWRVRKDGSRFWASVLITPLRDEAGQIRGFSKVTRDITERKLAEEALHESSRRTENVLESITDAFVAVDREWRYTYINDRALRRMQDRKGEELPREEFLGKSMWEEFPEAVCTTIYEKYHEAMREHKTVEFKTYFSPSDEWIEAHAYPSEDGLAIYCRDVTERKKVEDQLAYHANLLENIQDAVIATDEHLVVTAWNKGAEQMYGWRANEVLGRHLWEAVPVDLSEEQRAEALRELSERGRFRTEATTYGKDGTPVYVDGITIALRREQGEGEITGYVNIRRDITERKWAEERVEEGREAERSRMARDLHDEALQDLTDALLQTQQIRSLSEDSQQTQRLVRLLATLDRIGPQLRGAIYDLRLEGEQTRLFPELLESLVELHRGMAPESDIALEVHDGVLSGPLGERGRQLLRILGEALTNVRRHSGAENVRVSVGITEGKIWAKVQDDGRGYDVAQQEEDSEQALSAAGGLGIRGMRERARALGGDLKIESGPETGTKVRFEMTLTPEREEPEEEVRILLVDDHAAVREALASAFEQQAGFEVVGQAASLAEARQMIEALQEVDVAVVDLGLSDGYGGDVIGELRVSNPQAQALVLSASFDRAEVARAVERGAAGVLPKTVHLIEVVDAVRRLRAGETLMPLEEVVELLRFAGGKREEEYAARRALAQLTPREKEVLQTLAEGLDTREIAERLNMSVRTERNHMASVMAKLGVHSQLQALVFALRYGVVEIS